MKAPALLQVTENSECQSAATKFLREAALKADSLRLAVIAMKVKLDAFVRVNKAIDDMITQLAADDQEEYEEMIIDPTAKRAADTKSVSLLPTGIAARGHRARTALTWSMSTMTLQMLARSSSAWATRRPSSKPP